MEDGSGLDLILKIIIFIHSGRVCVNKAGYNRVICIGGINLSYKTGMILKMLIRSVPLLEAGSRWRIWMIFGFSKHGKLSRFDR